MADLTQDEADKCSHCGAVLRDPPNCCETARKEWSEKLLKETHEAAKKGFHGVAAIHRGDDTVKHG